jgi:hypothetical protein
MYILVFFIRKNSFLELAKICASNKILKILLEILKKNNKEKTTIKALEAWLSLLAEP